jgi:hypothetical protein
MLNQRESTNSDNSFSLFCKEVCPRYYLGLSRARRHYIARYLAEEVDIFELFSKTHDFFLKNPDKVSIIREMPEKSKSKKKNYKYKKEISDLIGGLIGGEMPVCSKVPADFYEAVILGLANFTS